MMEYSDRLKYYLIYLNTGDGWKYMGSTTTTSYNLKLTPNLFGGHAKVKIVPVNSVGQGDEIIVDVPIPVDMVLWTIIIVVIIGIIASIVLMARKRKGKESKKVEEIQEDETEKQL